MVTGAELIETLLPEGEAYACITMPILTQAHTSRLRKLWAFGRPVHLSELSGIELDLFVHGLLEKASERHYSASAVVTLTKRGVAHLNEARQTLIQSQRAHHQLGARLASHLRAQGFHTWENIEICNPASPPALRTWGAVRPDVFACLPSLKARNAAPAIYEVKVSRADFLADVARVDKRSAYSDLAEAVYYCCQDGLLNKTEVPDGYGLLCEVEPGTFVLRKKARRKKEFTLAVDVAMTLMVKRQVPLGDLE